MDDPLLIMAYHGSSELINSLCCVANKVMLPTRCLPPLTNKCPETLASIGDQLTDLTYIANRVTFIFIYIPQDTSFIKQ